MTLVHLNQENNRAEFYTFVQICCTSKMCRPIGSCLDCLLLNPPLSRISAVKFATVALTVARQSQSQQCEWNIFSHYYTLNTTCSHRLQQCEWLYVAETKRYYTLTSLKLHLIEPSWLDERLFWRRSRFHWETDKKQTWNGTALDRLSAVYADIEWLDALGCCWRFQVSAHLKAHA